MTPIERPRIADLAYGFYDRAISTTSTEPLGEPTIVRTERLALELRIAIDGHLVVGETPTARFTEWVGWNDLLVADGSRRIGHRFDGERRGRCRLAGVQYQIELQVDRLPAEVFSYVHDDLLAQSQRIGILRQFRPHHRLGLAPFGYVVVEPVPTGLTVRAFHTFPDELAVVKTLSLFERDSAVTGRLH